jgi:hypothetical protein
LQDFLVGIVVIAHIKNSHEGANDPGEVNVDASEIVWARSLNVNIIINKEHIWRIASLRYLKSGGNANR